MSQGFVKWFNDGAGYGFITGTDGSDYFVHYSAIRGSGFKSLLTGQPVTFEPINSMKGASAVNVTPSEHITLKAVR